MDRRPPVLVGEVLPPAAPAHRAELGRALLAALALRVIAAALLRLEATLRRMEPPPAPPICPWDDPDFRLYRVVRDSRRPLARGSGQRILR